MPVLSAPERPTHSLPHAEFTSLATPSRGSTETSVWRVHLRPGGEPTWHSVTREEIFVVLSGELRVRWRDTDTHDTLRSGDVLVVPVGRVFALDAQGELPAELLCCLPVGGQAQLPGGEAFTPPWAL